MRSRRSWADADSEEVFVAVGCHGWNADIRRLAARLQPQRRCGRSIYILGVTRERSPEVLVTGPASGGDPRR